MISIIIPNYNNVDYIYETLLSVFNQTEKNIEVIIIDDGSELEKYKLLKEIVQNNFKEKNIVLLKNKKNFGLPNSLNRAISNAKGTFIARIDNDDLWINKEKIKVQKEILEKEKLTVLIGTKYLIGENLNSAKKLTNIESTNEEIRNVLLYKNPFCHSSVMFRKKDFDKVGGYNSKLKYTEDHDLWIRLSQIGKIKILEENHVFYRESVYGMSKKTNKIIKKYYSVRILFKFFSKLPNRIKAIIKVSSYVFGLYKIKRIIKI